jgi:hypothetical protein
METKNRDCIVERELDEIEQYNRVPGEDLPTVR